MTFMVTATLRSPRKVKMAARVFTCRARTREKFVRGQLHRDVCVCGAGGGVHTQGVLGQEGGLDYVSFCYAE